MSCTCVCATEAKTDASVSEVAPELTELAQLARRRGETYGLLSRLYRVEADEALLAELRAMRFPAATGSDAMDRGRRLITRPIWAVRPTVWPWSSPWTTRARSSAPGSTAMRRPIPSRASTPPRTGCCARTPATRCSPCTAPRASTRAAPGRTRRTTWPSSFRSRPCCATVPPRPSGPATRTGAVELFKTQRGFLEGHLLNWVPALTADMRRFAKTDLYCGLAELTDGFLATDRAFLSELLGDEGAPVREEPAQA